MNRCRAALRGPWTVPLLFLMTGCVVVGQAPVAFTAAPWLIAWLCWPIVGAVLRDARPGDPLGLALCPPALVPALALTGVGTELDLAATVERTLAVPVLLAIGVLLPAVVVLGGDAARRAHRLPVLLVHGVLVASLVSVRWLAQDGTLDSAVAAVATVVVAGAPALLAWSVVDDAPPSWDVVGVTSALVALAGALLVVAYALATSAVRISTPQGGETATVLLAAVASLTLAPLWMLARRSLLARVFGPGRIPGSAQTELAHRLGTYDGSADLLAAAGRSVAAAVRSPGAAVVLGPDVDACDGAAVVPLFLGATRTGSLVVQPRRPGSRFTAADLRLLRALAPQVAFVVKAAQLADQLALAEEATRDLRERERRRLHADLHDVIGPLLAGMGMHVTALRSVRPDDEVVQVRLDDVQAAVRTCQAEVRRLMEDFTTQAAPHRPGLTDGLRRMLGDWQRAAADGAGPTFESDLAPVPGLPPDVEAALNRVAGEAITNFVRHARADHCRVTLCARDAAVLLVVEDDGTGLRSPGTGVGLTSMRERLTAVGGRLDVGTRPGGGTRVVATVPQGAVP